MILKKNVAIVGGGASALMLAVELNSEKYSVSIYERNKNLGRKFLVAGDGGLNLTHSEAKIDFSKKYSPSKFMLNAFENFDNKDLINWFKQKGIQTYIGSSNRVFPIKGIKPINVLRVFEDELKRLGCFLFQNYKWIGWNSNNGLVFENNNEIKNIEADIIVFALGGGSWKVTGSDGSWLNLFKDKFIECSPFISSNCAFQVNWQAALGTAEGMALKNCNFFVNGVLIKGEAVLTKYGIEGGAIYALSKEIRENLLAYKMAELIIDFKPTLDQIKIFDFLKSKGNFSTKDILSKKLNIRLAISGNIADGNISVISICDVNEIGDRQSFFKLLHDSSDLVISLGGSMSSEGGRGRTLTPYMNKEFNPQMILIFKKIKNIFDPQYILNPNVKFDTTEDQIKELLTNTYQPRYIENY